MERYKIGMLAKSMAGHDMGHVYVIIDEDDTYIYLADGRIRTLQNPKKKRKKHVQLICKEHDVTAVDNVAIKRMLKEFNTSVKEERK